MEVPPDKILRRPIKLRSDEREQKGERETSRGAPTL